MDYTWADRIVGIVSLLFTSAFAMVLFLYYETYARARILESEVKRLVSANRIGRTIVKNYCTIQYVTDDNEIKEEVVEVWGHLPPKSIDRKIARITGHERLLVTSIKTETFYASMPIETFIENATVIEQSNLED